MNALSASAAFGGGRIPVAPFPGEGAYPSNPAQMSPAAGGYAAKPAGAERAAVPDAVKAPDAIGQTDPSKKAVADAVRPSEAPQKASFPERWGAPAPARSEGGPPDHLSAYLKDMAHSIQERYDKMNSMMSKPLPIPSFPGGAEMVASEQTMLETSVAMQELQLDMTFCENLRSVPKAVIDKMTDMKD